MLSVVAAISADATALHAATHAIDFLPSFHVDDAILADISIFSMPLIATCHATTLVITRYFIIRRCVSIAFMPADTLILMLLLRHVFRYDAMPYVATMMP